MSKKFTISAELLEYFLTYSADYKETKKDPSNPRFGLIFGIEAGKSWSYCPYVDEEIYREHKRLDEQYRKFNREYDKTHPKRKGES